MLILEKEDKAEEVVEEEDVKDEAEVEEEEHVRDEEVVESRTSDDKRFLYFFCKKYKFEFDF